MVKSLREVNSRKRYFTVQKKAGGHLAHRIAVNYRIVRLLVCSHPKPGSSWFNLLWLQQS